MTAAVLVCAGCAQPGPAPVPAATSRTVAATASPAPVAAPRTVKWIDLQPGDCLAGRPPTDPAEVTVTVVDCATAHLAEAYLRANIPVDTALTDTASARCEAGFIDYAGKPTADGGFTVSYLIDSEQDRTANNRCPLVSECVFAVH